ncbi:MAG: hypothetical protein WDN23_05205 [Edaphobacter sp.]
MAKVVAWTTGESRHFYIAPSLRYQRQAWYKDAFRRGYITEASGASSRQDQNRLSKINISGHPEKRGADSFLK